MNLSNSLNAVTGYLGANAAGRFRSSESPPRFPAIAITRQVGARATSVGELLIERFAAKQVAGSPPWTLFGRELIQHVLRESNLPERLEKFFPEDASHSWRESLELIVGLHPPSYEINRRCHETIANLLRLGHVIVVGRCCNILGRSLPNVLNLRLVGSLERRVKYLALRRGESERDAMAYLKKEDLERKRYAKENFNLSNLDEPTLYDLVVNTDRLSDQTIASVVEEAMERKFAQTDQAPQVSRV